eukprot:365624-Chlamydomonas_euryale.AAC.1
MCMPVSTATPSGGLLPLCDYLQLAMRRGVDAARTRTRSHHKKRGGECQLAGGGCACCAPRRARAWRRRVRADLLVARYRWRRRVRPAGDGDWPEHPCSTALPPRLCYPAAAARSRCRHTCGVRPQPLLRPPVSVPAPSTDCRQVLPAVDGNALSIGRADVAERALPHSGLQAMRSCGGRSLARFRRCTR